jgi:serine/threonine protein kinase
MELIRGETLAERVRSKGVFTPKEALEVGVQVARALAAAESHGLVHRDIKPSNLMLDADPDADKSRATQCSKWLASYNGLREAGGKLLTNSPAGYRWNCPRNAKTAASKRLIADLPNFIAFNFAREPIPVLSRS